MTNHEPIQPITPEQAKADIRSRGLTIKAWAKKNRFPTVSVYRVLNGQYKANHGTAHKIATKLGIKIQGGCI